MFFQKKKKDDLLVSSLKLQPLNNRSGTYAEVTPNQIVLVKVLDNNNQKNKTKIIHGI